MNDKPKPNKLYDDLQGQLETDDLRRIKDFLYNNPIRPNDLQNCSTFPAICRELERLEKIKPGDLDFKFLEDMFGSLQILTLRQRVLEFVANATSRQSANEASKKRKIYQSTGP